MIDARIGIPAWLLFGIVGAFVATMKGRGGCFWFAFCGVLGPIGLVVAAVVSRKDLPPGQ